MKKALIFCGGLIIGLWLSTRIELRTGECMVYHYDRIFHPDLITR